MITSRFSKDVAERVIKTFIEAFAAIWLAPVAIDILNGSATTAGIWAAVADTSVLDKAFVGGLGAAIALGLGLFGKRVGSPTTAAWLPAEDDTPRA